MNSRTTGKVQRCSGKPRHRTSLADGLFEMRPMLRLGGGQANQCSLHTILWLLLLMPWAQLADGMLRCSGFVFGKVAKSGGCNGHLGLA